MSDSALSVRYQKFRYQAQSDIADHGYRTKCPPMHRCQSLLRVIQGVSAAGHWAKLVLEIDIGGKRFVYSCFTSLTTSDMPLREKGSKRPA
jgi:hypothetical protein